jgi:hypothetical protein
MQLTHGQAIYSFEEFKNPFIASTYGAPTASAKFHRSQKRDPDYDIFTHKQHHQGFSEFQFTIFFRYMCLPNPNSADIWYHIFKEIILTLFAQCHSCQLRNNLARILCLV